MGTQLGKHLGTFQNGSAQIQCFGSDKPGHITFMLNQGDKPMVPVVSDVRATNLFSAVSIVTSRSSEHLLTVDGIAKKQLRKYFQDWHDRLQELP